MEKVNDVAACELQQIEGLRMIFRGLAMLATNMAEVLDLAENPAVMKRIAAEMEGESHTASADATPVAALPVAPVSSLVQTASTQASQATATQPAQAMQPAPAIKPAKTVQPAAAEPPKPMDINKPDEFFNGILSKEKIERDDVQRAMGFVLMARGKRGQNPAAIGEALSQFHGARCLSELQEEDFRGYIEAIRKL